MSFEDEDDVKDSRILHHNGQEIDLLEKALEYRQKLGWNSELRELYAFVSFGTSYPTTFSSLVDSYSTKESGIPNFMLVSLALADLGFKPLSIRLDSGDLAELSKFAKAFFKKTGE